MKIATSVLFIATKPLQIMMAMVIREKLKPGEFHLYVVNDFFNVAEISEHIKSCDRGWVSVVNFSTRQAALEGSLGKSFDKIFLDSDVGVRSYQRLRIVKKENPEVTLAVYEEGRGTYKNDHYSASKSALLRVLGIGERLGGCRLTDELWIYDKCEYLRVFPHSKVAIKEIDKPLITFIEENSEVLKKIFMSSSSNVSEITKSENCTIYLSSWSVDKSVVNSLQERLDDCYVKLHPHIKEFDASYIQESTRLVPASIPAEILIMDLAKRYLHLVIYHHNCSVERYVAMSNVEYINLND